MVNSPTRNSPTGSSNRSVISWTLPSTRMNAPMISKPRKNVAKDPVDLDVSHQPPVGLHTGGSIRRSHGLGSSLLHRCWPRCVFGDLQRLSASATHTLSCYRLGKIHLFATSSALNLHLLFPLVLRWKMIAPVGMKWSWCRWRGNYQSTIRVESWVLEFRWMRICKASK